MGRGLFVTGFDPSLFEFFLGLSVLRSVLLFVYLPLTLKASLALGLKLLLGVKSTKELLDAVLFDVLDTFVSLKFLLFSRSWAYTVLFRTV